MGKWVRREVKPCSAKKLFKSYLMSSLIFGLILIFGAMSVDYLDDDKNGKKWKGCLIGCAIWLFDIVLMILSFDVFKIPALAYAVICWHFCGIVCFGIFFKTGSTDTRERNSNTPYKEIVFDYSERIVEQIESQLEPLFAITSTSEGLPSIRDISLNSYLRGMKVGETEHNRLLLISFSRKMENLVEDKFIKSKEQYAKELVETFYYEMEKFKRGVDL